MEYDFYDTNKVSTNIYPTSIYIIRYSNRY